MPGQDEDISIARSLMPAIARQKRSKTAEQILDVAQHLMQTLGYSAISYQDIADEIDIRKASIHYHFPSKTDLGIAVIERYSAMFGEALAELAEDQSKSSMEVLERYFEPFIAYANSPDYVCLCGALAGEFPALPEEMRERVRTFFNFHQDWLARLLERGMSRGDIFVSGSAQMTARMVFGSLQGALLIKRATGNTDQLFGRYRGAQAPIGS